jgi:hypothetical protein
VHETYNQIHVDSTEIKVELQNGSLANDPIPIIKEPTPTVEAKNGAVANGRLTNGTTHTKEHKAPVVKQQSFGRQLFLGILDILVILLLVSIVVIAVFEVRSLCFEFT